ncbi:DUF4175 domain-containing protein [Paracoccus sp. (in: a-proteobacteria)]|uniref:DUF4175 domain-containing protein n=1 Tax=Paracoccus sp. TaxID=267 RepID=UPI0026DEC2A9|nr:DUF4175 family protein [Paracoccus sp. (in: a-proteobacteria)]MDO5647326.1 DUF4175 family protein [Paracoccus sp. (in: a-proteobacteria)]
MDISAQKITRRALHLTRWGMIWERVAAAFWPLFTAVAMLWAGFALGAVAVLPWLAGLLFLGVIAAAVWGGLRFRPVRAAQVVDRLDRSLPGRPLTALSDQVAIGDDGALWRAHLAQMQAVAGAARAVPPDAGLARRDPLGLRLMGAVAAVMAILFGGVAQIGQGLSAIAATATVSRPAPVVVGPAWEGWAEPPAYTRRPVMYLNTLEDDAVDLPKGSVLTFRLYGGGAVVQDVGPDLSGGDAPSFRADQSGVVTVGDRRFAVSVAPDDPPVIQAGAAPVRRADGRLVQDYTASDDHGVAHAQAVITLDLPAVDRRFGLTVAPEPRDDLDLNLPLPRGDRRQVRGELVQDLARHPWANLPVVLTLRAVDGIEQVGESAPMPTILPGKRFFHPLAAALIELRRDVLWSRDNAPRSAEILRAVTWQPDGFVADDLYGELRGAVQMLETGLTPEQRDRLADALWQAAMQLEDGGLSDALEAMRQAQQKLSEAIRQGASPDEIQRLMDELRAATDAYTRMLAEQDQRDPAERFTRNQQSQPITGDQIQQMMDEIQRLMNEGRMTEAQELLNQFNRMMENLQIRQGDGRGGGDGPGGSGAQGQAMNRLADTLRDQQDLSDDAFRDLQGSGQRQSGDLADRQRALREDLGQQRGLLPGQGSDAGDHAARELDNAGRAMEQAERALRDGDTGRAMQHQADAIQAMRQGMRALGDMLTPQQGAQGEPGESSDQAGGQGAAQRPALDPLGRQAGGGSTITSDDPLAEGADPARRARDLLDEIRRRSGERARPQTERDYLGRLLDRF